jgi:hypothetical protein
MENAKQPSIGIDFYGDSSNLSLAQQEEAKSIFKKIAGWLAQTVMEWVKKQLVAKH